jgi:hypothetical protein
MDQIEQRTMVKLFLLKMRESKLIHRELVSPFHDNLISLSTVKSSLTGLKSGELSTGGEERSGRPLISLHRLFSAF